MASKNDCRRLQNQLTRPLNEQPFDYVNIEGHAKD